MYGYTWKYLYTEIGKTLGLDKTHNFIIIGWEIWDRRRKLCFFLRGAALFESKS